VERVDLGEMIGEIATTDELADVTPDVVVSGDRAALRGMVVNLIDNGRHHGGHVRVALRAEEDEAILEVSDDGPGISETDRDRIFDRFYRAPERRGSPGAGLGLPIARATAERWGGTLRLIPSPSGGRFEVRLPRSP
jgi:two-component system sensor histidine kinase MprB